MGRDESGVGMRDLLNEHIFRNNVQTSAGVFRQRTGIPQGSVLSTLLCHLYYADFEREHLCRAPSQGGVGLHLRVPSASAAAAQGGRDCGDEEDDASSLATTLRLSDEPAPAIGDGAESCSSRTLSVEGGFSDDEVGAAPRDGVGGAEGQPARAPLGGEEPASVSHAQASATVGPRASGAAAPSVE